MHPGEENFKTATFLSCIGEDALEIFEGMDFPTDEDRTKYEVVKKFSELCLGETNETYERFIFNRRQKSDEEPIDKYVTTLRKLAQTCNFCAGLHDSLIRDRLVLGINDNATQKKLLQDRKLTLTKAIDICRSNERMKKQLKSLKQSNEEGINMVNSKTPEKSGTREQPARGRCKYCYGTHPRKKELCPAFDKTFNHCGRANHFANACLQKQKNPRQKPIHAIYENCSSDSAVFSIRGGYRRFTAAYFASDSRLFFRLL
jgi:hypothetical protein